MIRAALFALSLTTAFVAPAHATGLTAQQNVLKLVETVDESGETVTTLVPAEKIAPGDTVVYSLEYDNAAAEPAENVKLTMPVPSEVSYLENSATYDGVAVAYSADGGDSFSSRGDLTVSVDGEPREALSSDITHIRWVFEEPIAAGASGEVSFRAVLE